MARFQGWGLGADEFFLVGFFGFVRGGGTVEGAILFRFGGGGSGGAEAGDGDDGLAEGVHEVGFEGFDGEVAGEAALFGDGDGAGLFGDDDDDGVGFLGEAEGCTVSGAELGGDFAEGFAFGEGELDAGSGEFAAADDDAHVVQDGAGPEDGIEELGGEVGVHDGAVLDQAAEADIAFDGDERADGVFGAVSDATADGIHGGANGAAGGAEEACLAEAGKGTAELGLEDDDDGDCGDVEEFGIEEGNACEAFAAEGDDHVADDEEEGSALNEARATGAAKEFEDGVDDDPDEEEFKEYDPDGVLCDARGIVAEEIEHHL